MKGAMILILQTIDKVTQGESGDFKKLVFESTINICRGKLDALVSQEGIKKP